MDETVAMNGGDGPNSYTQNSKYQEELINIAKVLLVNSIQQELDVPNKARVITIADLGCSVGPNTFSCVQTIIDAVKHRLKTQDPDSKSKLPEFHVFFNDTVSNDFNTLFKALPADRQYMAAGVPGSFHKRLFPEKSMNIMHSSFALHWLTKIPEEVTREGSPAWNKGKITYATSPNEVADAFRQQFLSDSKGFFSSRLVELVSGGLTVVLMLCRPEGTPPSESLVVHLNDCLGDTLMDMVHQGLLSESSVDSFNIPVYVPTASEVKKVVSSIKHIEIQNMEEIWFPKRLSTPEDVRMGILHVRVVLEGILSNHFGSQLMDQLFERYSLKLEALSKTSQFTRFEWVGNLFLVIKRNSFV